MNCNDECGCEVCDWACCWSQPVNFLYLASAPPPPPPPPDTPAPAQSLEPGELADSDPEGDAKPPGEALATAAGVPGTVAVGPGGSSVPPVPGYAMPDTTTVAANPVLETGYAAAGNMAPGNVAPGDAAATLDAPGSGAVIQAPPAPAELIEAATVQLVAPPVLIEKTNGAAPSSPPPSTSSTSSSSRHEKKKKKKDKEKEKVCSSPC